MGSSKIPVRWIENLTSKGEVSISKKVLPVLPEDFRETRMGDRMGAINQFRNASGLHAREYRDRFVVHLDKASPEDRPLRHLVEDSPETLFALGAGFVAARLASRCLDKSRAYGTSTSKALFNPAIFGFFSFLAIDRILRRIKHLLLP